MSVCVSPLVQPTLTTNTDLETLLCTQCPKTFSSTKILQQHQQMFHSEKSILVALKAAPDATVGMDRTFVCETCGKAFRFRSNLAEHRSVHTALKPYVCKFCGKSSRLKGNLTKHILKHHKKEQNEAIAKDDIIVKKAPKIIKTEPGTTTNGTTSTTSTPTTVTSAVSPTTNGTNGNSHNNNNNNNVVNNNLRTVKAEVEDPDYPTLAATKPTTHTIVAKVVSSTPRARPQPKEAPVVTTVTTPVLIVPNQPEEVSFLPKDVTTDIDNFRNIMISLGLDFDNSIKLPDPTKPMKIKKEISSTPDSIDSDDDTPPLPDIPPVGGSATLALIVAAANASLPRDGSPDSIDGQNGNSPDRELSPESDQSSSSSDSCPSPPKVLQCKECGKVMKKRCHLPIHMTMSHGYPPPESFDAAVAEKKMNGTGDIDVDHELRKIALAIEDLKAAQAAAPKVEDALTYIDSRVGNLEKSLETALNSIYTLVQLQSGMTSSVNRLREDSTRHFNDMKERLDRSWSPRRIYRRSSVKSESRDRSRSPQ